jgi:hypothetical protein
MDQASTGTDHLCFVCGYKNKDPRAWRRAATGGMSFNLSRRFEYPLSSVSA